MHNWSLKVQLSLLLYEEVEHMYASDNMKYYKGLWVLQRLKKRCNFKPEDAYGEMLESILIGSDCICDMLQKQIYSRVKHMFTKPI